MRTLQRELSCISIEKEKEIIQFPTKTNKLQRDKLLRKRGDLLSYPTSNGPINQVHYCETPRMILLESYKI